jgi:carbon starvation protein CstA
LAHETYIPFYEIFVFVSLLILEYGLIRGKSWALYTLTATILIALAMQLMFRPYRRVFDNIGIIINSLTILTFLALLITR